MTNDYANGGYVTGPPEGLESRVYPGETFLKVSALPVEFTDEMKANIKKRIADLTQASNIASDDSSPTT